MKSLITIFTVLISAITIAQNSNERKVGEFRELKVYDLIEVELIKSDINKVIITGDNSSNVLVNNKNGTLKIKMKLSESFDGNNTIVKLYYTSIDIIDVNEGARVTSKEEMKQFEIDLRAQEGGIIDVNLDVNYAIIKSVTGAVVKASGVTKKESVSLLTGGVFKGSDLKSENSDVSINAAGEAYVNVSKVLDIKIKAGGDVYIYGKPETVNESTVFGGRIKRMD